VDAIDLQSAFHLRGSNIVDVPRAIERVPDVTLRDTPRTVRAGFQFAKTKHEIGSVAIKNACKITDKLGTFFVVQHVKQS
jgi:hypothetical protein